MVDIQAKEVIDKISEDLKVQPAMAIPRELAKQIQLIYNVNPVRNVQIATGTASDATSGIIHTTSAVKDTFLIAANISVAKDVVNTSLETFLVATAAASNLGLQLMRLKYEPVTAGQFSMSQSFPIPIKLRRSTTITIENTTAIASIDAAASILFFETDPQ